MISKSLHIFHDTQQILQRSKVRRRPNLHPYQGILPPLLCPDLLSLLVQLQQGAEYPNGILQVRQNDNSSRLSPSLKRLVCPKLRGLSSCLLNLWWTVQLIVFHLNSSDWRKSRGIPECLREVPWAGSTAWIVPSHEGQTSTPQCCHPLSGLFQWPASGDILI